MNVDDAGKIPSIVDPYLKGSNPPELVFLQLDSEKFPRRTMDFPSDVRKYVMTHPRVKVAWGEVDKVLDLQLQGREPVAYIFSNAQSLSKLNALKTEFTNAFKVNSDDVIVFMNLAFPYFQELDFFRKLQC